jgi:hypothetical protein
MFFSAIIMLVFGCFILIVSMTISNQAFLGGSISWLKWPLGDKVIVYAYDYFAIIQQFVDRYVAPLGHFILISNQPFLALSP